jgi:pentatricopeptide repeat protein
LESVQQDAISKCGHLECNDIGTCETQARPEGAATISTNVWPDSVTFVGVLNAYASVVALERGRRVHHQIIQSGLELDFFVGNSLVDMYAKCVNMEDAWKMFHKMPSKDVVTWTAILGHGNEALQHFEWMCDEGVQQDDITFVCLLSACSHAGLVDEGMCHYASMIKYYIISAKLEHFMQYKTHLINLTETSLLWHCIACNKMCIS